MAANIHGPPRPTPRAGRLAAALGVVGTRVRRGRRRGAAVAGRRARGTRPPEPRRGLHRRRLGAPRTTRTSRATATARLPGGRRARRSTSRNPRRPTARLALRLASPGTWTEKTIVRHVATPGLHRRPRRDELAGRARGRRHGRGFALYDVTNPRRPRQLALVRTEPRGSHEIWLARSAAAPTSTRRSSALGDPVAAAAPDATRRRGRQARLPHLRRRATRARRRGRRLGRLAGARIHPTAASAGPLDGNFVHSVITNAPGRARTSLLGPRHGDPRHLESAAPRYLGRTASRQARSATHTRRGSSATRTSDRDARDGRRHGVALGRL